MNRVTIPEGYRPPLSTFDTHRATASYSVAGHALSAESLHFGYSSDVNKPQFKGYLDEIRVYSRALPNEEIVSFADHTLAGNEDGLVAYIPLDEGVQALKKAYDYSKTAGAANENHGDLAGGSFDTTIPDSNQFGLLGYTDKRVMMPQDPILPEEEEKIRICFDEVNKMFEELKK